MNLSGKRLISLDAFRGFTIIGMIIVNSPGSWNYIFPPLEHAKWNGLTPTDLVFPFFLFIVGVSIVFAYLKKISLNIPKKKLIWKAVKRTIIIFILGIILNLIGSHFQSFRLMGVLQRIALVYFVCSILFLYTGIRMQIILSVIILLVYWIVISTIPTPGIELDLATPGKNLTVFFDSILPGKLYFGTWDPEGILSTFPAIVTSVSGIIAGYIIISKGKIEESVIKLFYTGFIMTIAGYIWSWFFPFNKGLWSSSYVVFTSGLAYMVLATLMWFIDYLKINNVIVKTGIIFGTNAITAYVIHGLLYIPLSLIPVGNIYGIQPAFMHYLTSLGIIAELVSLFWAIIYTGLCFIPIWILYKRNIIIKV